MGVLDIIRKEVGGNRELHEIQEILSASVFQKMPILQAFSRTRPIPLNLPFPNQLPLFQLYCDTAERGLTLVSEESIAKVAEAGTALLREVFGKLI